MSELRRVKFFVALLYSHEDESAIAQLTSEFGTVDIVSREFEFVETDYYENEMGRNLRRRFHSFETLRVESDLVLFKKFAARIEAKYSKEGKRTVNIDPGYLDFYKVVLASSKYAGHRIYIGNGVYADMILLFEKGKYKPFSWTFPDFRSGKYDQWLLAVRKKFKMQVNQ